jgi:WD40 repeat protein
MLGAVIYISESQTKMAWKFGISVSHGKAYIVDLVLRHYHGANVWDKVRFYAGIHCVQYGASGHVIAAGASDGRSHLICAETGAKILCLKGHSGAVLCVDWVPEGSQLVSGSGFAAGRFGEQLELKLWSPSTGECLNTLEGHRYLRWFVLLRRQNCNFRWFVPLRRQNRWK